ncbi:MAG TPA: preprotein translocase subunit YajC [Actinomycetota bacterium]|nr:preprotein translocase subunit YajC [Actinomycetota bacterium]
MEGGASSLIFIVLMGAIFYFMLVRPQRRRVQQHRALVDSLSVGDEVVTIGGLYGTITRLSDDDVELQVDSSTTLRFLKTSIARVVVEDDPTAQEQDEAEALQRGEEDPRS